MRFLIVALAAGGIALAAAVGGSHSASAEKTKMGCEKGAEVWDAAAGRCMPGQSKWKRQPAPQPAAAPEPAKKGPAKKGKAPAKKT